MRGLAPHQDVLSQGSFCIKSMLRAKELGVLWRRHTCSPQQTAVNVHSLSSSQSTLNSRVHGNLSFFSEVKMLNVCKKPTAKRDHLSRPSPRFSVPIPRWQKRHRNPDMKTANSTGKQLMAPASPLASELKPHPKGSEEIMQSFMHFQMWDLARVLRCSYPRIYYIGY